MASPRKPTNASPPSPAAAVVGEDLRMRDLVRLAGLPRETIHFYLTQGLLPKPLKTGRNTAVYGPEHLDRLQRIKDLQERHFLPLRAIKAVLEEGTVGGFSEEQEAMLRRVRALQPPARSLAAGGDVALAVLVPSRVSRADLETMKRLGFIEVKGRGTQATVSAEDARILECWGDVGSLFRPGEERLDPDVLGTYDDAMASLVAREAHVFTRRYANLSGERATELLEASEPVIVRLLAALRRKKIATLLEGVVSAGSSGRDAPAPKR